MKKLKNLGCNIFLHVKTVKLHENKDKVLFLCWIKFFMLDKVPFFMLDKNLFLSVTFSFFKKPYMISMHGPILPNVLGMHAPQWPVQSDQEEGRDVL